MSIASGSPLSEPATSSQFLKLGRTLWSWELCENCKNKTDCSNPECPTQLQNRLSAFFKFYQNIVRKYLLSSAHSRQPALTTHEDVLNLIMVIRNNTDLSKVSVANLAFPGTGEETSPISAMEQERATNLVAKVMAMTTCTSYEESLLLLEHGLNRKSWQAAASFSEFIVQTFPAGNSGNSIPANIKKALSAKKLKRIGLQIVPTEDLSSHLKLDRRERTVHFFHHAGFLKENLRVTRSYESNLSASGCLKLGCIPRQLALEALDTIQNILFPLDDAKSYSLLSSLISSASLDPECQDIPSTLHRSAEEAEGEPEYLYFGDRLAELYEEVCEPSPGSPLGRWIDRRKGTRHIMLATLTGIVFAIVLGILTLGVSGYQAWLGYQQWQHPKESK
ncbi:hypothetical protein TWF694_011383 [Orbilia ellipsospora]|uniref:Uncharacterized protein n=1 Tax=Orbilia ellipsospora TaxID=2528407 RepID=A0AAV9X6G2_9PEZI